MHSAPGAVRSFESRTVLTATESGGSLTSFLMFSQSMRLFPFTVLLMLFPFAARAGTIDVQVLDAHGAPLRDAVVYAIPSEGRPVPPPRKTALMDQKDRMFIPHVLPVQTGTAVRFPNSDSVRHQVYSFSAAKTFQLPLYAGTPSRPVVFDKVGVVTLGCNIHDQMSAFVVVVDTPWFGRTDVRGQVALEDLPSGGYAVHVWYENMRSDQGSANVTVSGEDRHQVLFTAGRPAAVSGLPRTGG